MRIGYTTHGGCREYHMAAGDLIIIIDGDECLLQEHLIRILADAAVGDEEKLSLREVMKYVTTTYESLSS